MISLRSVEHTRGRSGPARIRAPGVAHCDLRPRGCQAAGDSNHRRVLGGHCRQLSSDAVVLTALCATLGSAALVDSARRKIPNAISLGTAATGVVLAATGLSGISLTSSLVGFFLGFMLMLPGHVLGATGAGDVKLFAAAGAVVGAGQIVPAFLLTAIVGGLLAVGIAVVARTPAADIPTDRSTVRTDPSARRPTSNRLASTTGFPTVRRSPSDASWPC